MNKHQRAVIVELAGSLARAMEQDEEACGPRDPRSPTYFASADALNVLDDLLQADKLARVRKKALRA